MPLVRAPGRHLFGVAEARLPTVGI